MRVDRSGSRIPVDHLPVTLPRLIHTEPGIHPLNLQLIHLQFPGKQRQHPDTQSHIGNRKKRLKISAGSQCGLVGLKAQYRVETPAQITLQTEPITRGVFHQNADLIFEIIGINNKPN